MGRSGLCLKMGKFCLISTELWPLIDVKKLFPLTIWRIFDQFSSNCIRVVDTRKEWFGIIYMKISLKRYSYDP